jgi:phospholipase/carboxylesterase
VGKRPAVVWRLVLVLVLLAPLVACEPELGMPSERERRSPPADDPYVIAAEPSANARTTAPTGMVPLGPASSTDGWLVVPEGYRPERPARLIVCLRGAGGTARAALRFFRDDVDARNLILVAPEARGPTWDPAVGGTRADAAFIEAALRRVFDRYAVSPRHVAVAGFSDGASFALTLGLTNGDLFRHVIAFSPGFMDVRTAMGSPRVFVSHGSSDDTLPIERTSEPIVADLEAAGYDVTFARFAGEHEVPERLREVALRWYLNAHDR